MARAWFQSSKRARTSVSVISPEEETLEGWSPIVVVSGSAAVVVNADAGTFVILGASIDTTRSVRTPFKLVAAVKWRDTLLSDAGAKAEV